MAIVHAVLSVHVCEAVRMFKSMSFADVVSLGLSCCASHCVQIVCSRSPDNSLLRVLCLNVSNCLVSLGGQLGVLFSFLTTVVCYVTLISHNGSTFLCSLTSREVSDM